MKRGWSVNLNRDLLQWTQYIFGLKIHLDIFNELDRWIPLISKYERLNFEDIDDKVIENIKF